MKNKIGTTFLCVAFSYFALNGQSAIIDQAQSLQAEIENLKRINQELRIELDSLNSLQNSNLPSGYYLRLNGGFAWINGLIYRIVKEIVGAKVVYSITSFSNAKEAFNLASSLRKLNLKDAEIVKIEAANNLSPNTKKISWTMVIED